MRALVQVEVYLVPHPLAMLPNGSRLGEQSL